jgi:hypothetical protein
MALRPFRIILAALALCLAVAAAGRAADLARCEQLAAQARRLPDTAWVKGFKALRPQLTLADPNAKASRLEARLAAMPSVRKALSD